MDNRKMKNAYDLIKMDENKREQILEDLLAENRRENIAMTDNNKKNLRKARKPAALIVAAAVAAVLAVSAGAMAVVRHYHRDSVVTYTDESTADYIEKNGLANGASLENEHVRISVDSVMNDGHQLYMITTFEALDEKGKEVLDSSEQIGFIPNSKFYFGDTSGGFTELNIENGAFEYKSDEKNEFTSKSYMYCAVIDGVDTSQPVTLMFYTDNCADLNNSNGLCFDDSKNLFKDLRVQLTLEPNIKATTLYSEDGDELYLSDMFASIEHDVTSGTTQAERFMDMNKLALVRNDGTTEIPFDRDNSDRKNDSSDAVGTWWIKPDNYEHHGGAYWFFGKAINFDEYKEVEFNGVRYMKK